jgi:hypothetical protein
MRCTPRPWAQNCVVVLQAVVRGVAVTEGEIESQIEAA